MITMVFEGKFPKALEDVIKECVDKASSGAGEVLFKYNGTVTLVCVGVYWSEVFPSVLNTAGGASCEDGNKLYAEYDYRAHVAASALTWVVTQVVNTWGSYFADFRTLLLTEQGFHEAFGNTVYPARNSRHKE